MSQFTAQQVESLIALHQDVVRFGSGVNSVGEEWVRRAEQRLGFQLPNSYKWFLNTYVGGEIGSEEIYSIYGVDFECANGGDVVYQYIMGLKNNLIGEKKLVISETDFGEVFFFDCSCFNGGEYPVMLRLASGDYVNYAHDFFEFLYKRIIAHA